MGHDPEALERAIALAEGEGVPLATQVVELVEAELACEVASFLGQPQMKVA